MRVKIDIDTNTFVRFFLVSLAFGAAILAIYFAKSALIIIGISLFLALALNPPVSWLARHFPGDKERRVGATAVAYIAVVAILGGVIFLLIPPVIEQSSRFAQTVPSLINQVTEQQTVLSGFVDRYGLESQVDAAIENAKAQASSVAANIGSVLVNGIGVALNGVVNLLFILVLTFLMLIEGPMWLKRIWGLYQDQEKLERHRKLISRMYRVVTGYVNGQMLVAAVAATCTLIVVLILSAIFKLPANLAIPLAAIVFIGGLIPMVGATVAAVLVGLVLLLNSVPAALVFVVYFIIYQQIENNFISPTIQSRAVELSALAILSAILIGVTLFGLLGGLIAIPVAGCIRVFMLEYQAYSRKKREASTKNPVKKLAAKLKES